MPTIHEILAKAFASRTGVRLALLFGSVARGSENEFSDVDVAVLGTEIDRLALAAELSAAVEREVDVVLLDDPGYPLLNAIVRDAVVVFESERGVASRWRAAALCELDTDRANWERMRNAYLTRGARRA